MSLEELKEFHTLGCKDLKKCGLAHRVYSDLTQVQKDYTNVEKLYDADLDTIYLKPVNADCVKYYVASLSSDPVNMETIGQLQNKLLSDENKSIYLALCDTSSNILYFKVSQGILDPAEDKSNASKSKKMKLDET